MYVSFKKILLNTVKISFKIRNNFFNIELKEKSSKKKKKKKSLSLFTHPTIRFCKKRSLKDRINKIGINKNIFIQDLLRVVQQLSRAFESYLAETSPVHFLLYNNTIAFRHISTLDLDQRQELVEDSRSSK